MDAHTKCPVCLDMLCLPVSTECGHNFCKDCLEGAFRVNSYRNRCPYCRKHLYRSLKINKVLEKLIEKLYPLDYQRRLKEFQKLNPVSDNYIYAVAFYKTMKAIGSLALSLCCFLLLTRYFKSVPSSLVEYVVKNLHTSSRVWLLIRLIARFNFSVLEIYPTINF